LHPTFLRPVLRIVLHTVVHDLSFGLVLYADPRGGADMTDYQVSV
jgi:hypothetical protein